MSESVRRRFRRAAVLAMTAAIGIAGAAGAQTAIGFDDHLDSDRPEAWAMSWFSSLVVMTGLGAAPELAPGGWEIGLEGGWVPSLSEEERRVGFIGNKVEDLNRTSVVGRLRLSAGLPGRWVLTGGWMPPVEVDGITPHVVSVGLRRPLAEGRAFRLDLGVTAQTGTFEGDLTCPEAAVAAGDDPARNPSNCLEPSDDEMTVHAGGVELTGSWRPAGAPSLRPYASVAGYYFDQEFQVRARYASVIDRTRLLADGTTFAATAGLDVQAGERTRLAAELFYSPLDVVRDPDEGSQNDPLFNARVLIGYRIR